MKLSDLRKITDATILTPSTQMLYALQRVRGGTTGHIYGGTVPPAEVARRRKANKAARAARRSQRLHR